VSTTEDAAAGPLLSPPRSAAQNRVLDAALSLIGEHGVGGTSLQMIADAIGLRKGAVYHHFKTKEEIVIALLDRELSRLEPALRAAESEQSPPRARELLLTQVIDIAIQRRGVTASVLPNDPVINRMFAEHQALNQYLQRLYGVLLGDAGEEARVVAAMLSNAIAGTIVHPLVADMDDDTLRAQMLHVMRRIIDLPPEPDRRPARPAKRTVSHVAKRRAASADGKDHGTHRKAQASSRNTASSKRQK
jgi:AcrR family transcriptional regulator